MPITADNSCARGAVKQLEKRATRTVIVFDGAMVGLPTRTQFNQQRYRSCRRQLPA